MSGRLLCPVCERPIRHDEAYCSKLCRQVAKKHKTSKVQHATIPVTNEIDLVLRRRAAAQETSVEQLLIDAVQRGFEK